MTTKVAKLYLDRLSTDDELDTLKGEYLSDSWILHDIKEDTDVYEKNSNTLILSYRKQRLDAETNSLAWDNYKDLSTSARGRGASAGPIDPTSVYWSKRHLCKTKGYKTGYLKGDGTPSKMSVNNVVSSSPIGYYESQKALGFDKPCRLTFNTKENMEKYEKGIPYIQEIDKWYKTLHQEHYKIQKERADKQPDYRIADTAFSTVTINRNFRTGLHKDAGDFGGYAMLSVLEYGSYSGGIFMIPAFGIGVDLRQGDVLCAKVSEYHCNTEIYTDESQDEYNKSLPVVFKKDTKVGILGLDKDYSRISFVSYLREKIINCNKI